ncbi:MAG: hypothetical protein R6U64_09735 [Bacteroidales bacterium]
MMFNKDEVVLLIEMLSLRLVFQNPNGSRPKTQNLKPEASPLKPHTPHV